jgi:hypothetical protein
LRRERIREEDVELARSIGIRAVIWKPQTLNEMGSLLAQQLEKLMVARADWRSSLQRAPHDSCAVRRAKSNT